MFSLFLISYQIRTNFQNGTIHISKTKHRTRNHTKISNDQEDRFIRGPGDFITKVKQIISQSDLISMSSFAGPSYFTMRSSVCMVSDEILIFSIFTISAKLDPVAYVGNVTGSVH